MVEDRPYRDFSYAIESIRNYFEFVERADWYINMPFGKEKMVFEYINASWRDTRNPVYAQIQLDLLIADLRKEYAP